MKSSLAASRSFNARRRLTLCGTCVLGALIVSSSPVLASKAIVIGDSIGVGVSMAARLPRLAHNSVTIRGSDALSQLKRAPRDAVAFISLGANDAVGSLSGVEKSVDRLVAAARDAHLRAVWIGPPCVMKPWNRNVVRLDEMLKTRLAGHMVYVSIADDQLCDKSLRAGDGVHFNMRGYSLLWERAREAAGVEIETGSTQDTAQDKTEMTRASTAAAPLLRSARAASDSK